MASKKWIIQSDKGVAFQKIMDMRDGWMSSFRRYLVCLVLSLFMLPIGHIKADDSLEMVNHFLQVLNKDPAPTLVDYQSLYGYVDHYELMLQWENCSDEAQQAPLRNMECYNQVLTAWSNKGKTPSLFLELLSQHIPHTTDIKILKREKLSGLSDFEGEKITAKVGRHQLVFWRPLKEQDEYGTLSLVEIDGVPVFRLVQKVTSSSILMALGLKPLIRPLTKQEQAEQTNIREERCSKNPDCVKQREEQRIRAVEHEKEREIRLVLAESYKQWCTDNQQTCDQDKQIRNDTSRSLRALSEGCAENFDHCLNEVKAILTRQKEGGLSPYCQAKPDDCRQLDEMRHHHQQESKERCKKSPEACMESALGKATRLAKEALGIN